RVLEGVASDPEVVVREIPTERHGTYYAMVNTSMSRKDAVRVKLGAIGAITFAASSEPLVARDGALELSLYPGELLAVHVAAP
ncbi:MAG TPA: hypothetical protein PLQ54_08155, partial [Armatimonadota bacterium]|nr:hypothetical protein [Armatimonadota bacterium]